mmetsp:Transcript_121394/g.241814  ORF Transcript_121394/g.241814 Transcript_121394/m.241814 type:complete len:391 (-) Transcript_121394:386-1558(-)
MAQRRPTQATRIPRAVKPADSIFERTLMLRIGRSQKVVHPALTGLSTEFRPQKKASEMVSELRVRNLTGTVLLNVPPSTESIVDVSDLKHKINGVAGFRITDGITEDRLLLFHGECVLQDDVKIKTLWPRGGGHVELQLYIRKTPEDDVKQEALILLKQYSVSNKDNRILDSLASMDLISCAQLQAVVEAIFTQALADPANSEAYANAAVRLRTRYPQFPSEVDKRPITFHRVLLNHCQNEFEKTPTRVLQDREKEKLHALLKFIGNLFLQNMLAAKVVGQVLHDLIGIGSSEETPREQLVECACVYLQMIGDKLLNPEPGLQAPTQPLMHQFCDRLRDLKWAMPEEIQAQIQGIEAMLPHDDWGVLELQRRLRKKTHTGSRAASAVVPG